MTRQFMSKILMQTPTVLSNACCTRYELNDSSTYFAVFHIFSNLFNPAQNVFSVNNFNKTLKFSEILKKCQYFKIFQFEMIVALRTGRLCIITALGKAATLCPTCCMAQKNFFQFSNASSALNSYRI